MKLAYIQARAFLVSALDHLGALRLLIVEARTLPTFAHLTLLRGALEPALQARWAVGGATDDRVARGLALEFENLDERRKFEEALGQGSLARRRIEELLDKAEELGLTSLNKHGKRYLAQAALKYVELMRALPSADPSARPSSDDSWVYRFLSGYAHAKTWATTLGITAVDRAPGGQEHGVLCRAEAVDTYLVEMVERVVYMVEAAIAELEELWSPATGRRSR